MGLQEIVNEIRKDSSAESENVIRQAEAEAEKIRSEKKTQLEVRYKALREAADVEFKRLRQKLMAKAELDAQREVQQCESDMIEKLITDIQKSILETLRKDRGRYVRYLVRAVKDSVSFFEGGKSGISFSREDEGLFESVKNESGAKLELLPASRISAGAVLISGNTYIDHSLETVFEKMRQDFVRIIVEEKGK
jgi:vacuolar-type H+-ATPase subunit E/Vma4